MIDIREGQTFIIGCVGDGRISRTIQRLSDQIPNVQTNDLWSHVAMTGVRKGNLIIAESHLKTGGVTIYDNWTDWLKVNDDNRYFIAEWSGLSLGKAITFADLKVKYGAFDLIRNPANSWGGMLIKDKNGMICSGMLARCDRSWHLVKEAKKQKRGTAPIGEYFDLVQPSNIQRALLESNTEIIEKEIN